jgi:hypothetical protein
MVLLACKMQELSGLVEDLCVLVFYPVSDKSVPQLLCLLKFMGLGTLVLDWHLLVRLHGLADALQPYIQHLILS